MVQEKFRCALNPLSIIFLALESFFENSLPVMSNVVLIIVKIFEFQAMNTSKLKSIPPPCKVDCTIEIDSNLDMQIFLYYIHIIRFEIKFSVQCNENF